VALVLLGLSIAAIRDVRAQTEQTRETWQRVSDLFGAAGVRAGAAVADVGSGDGFLTVRLSAAVGPNGKVYAVDIDRKVVEGLGQRVVDAGMGNVSVVLGAEDDPRLPLDSLDGAIILNAYHEMPQGVTILQHIFRALKPGAHVVLCEPVPETPGQSRASQMEHHVLDPALILDDLRAASFQVVDRKDEFATNLGGTHFGLVVATRP